MFHLDGVLFRDTFGTDEMREVFGEGRFIERFLEVEAALARAEADAGLIPEAAAAEITDHASLEHIDLEEVRANVEEIHLFTMAIIGAWKDRIGEAGEYVHWGATSQDVSDTAFLLQVREGLGIVRRDLDALVEILADLAEEYAETPMMGRTHRVHATPITAGLKFASWLDEFDRHRDRLDDLEDRLYAVEFFGATGTLASLGEVGLEVQERLADELDLEVPAVAWFTARDRLSEALDVLAQVAGTLDRIARQVLVLGRPEIAELREPIAEGKIGSSTMPHKRNPVKAEETVALGWLVRGHAATMDGLATGFDERDFGTWFPEFAVVPEAFCYVARMLDHGKAILGDLEVDEARMDQNFGIHGGLVASEAVMMALAEVVGRQTAHDIVHEHAMRALDGEGEFVDLLAADDRVQAALDDLDAVADPRRYTGVADRLARRAVERARE